MGNYDDRLEKKYCKRMIEIIRSKYINKKIKFKDCTGTISYMTKCADFNVKFTNSNKVYTLAFRMRGNQYIDYNDCTIRAYNKGYKTELDKIVNINDVVYFYGVENKDGTDIEKFYFYRINDKLNKILKYKKCIFDVLQSNEENITKDDFCDSNKKQIAEVRNNKDDTAFVTLTLDEIKACNAIIFYSED